MIKNKYINVISVVLIIISLGFAGFVTYTASGQEVKSSPLYEDYIFNGEVIDFQIVADETQWSEMLENASNEEYIPADLVINGYKISSVGIRPKGNSSLSQVVSSDSDRYSFKIKFDEYISGQTFYGLDKMVVNNMISDSTYMKEYLSYDMMNYLGVESPLMEYANISVNGEPWGLYLALEAYDESFLSRTDNDASGELYSVKMVTGGMRGMGGEQEERVAPNGDFDGMPNDLNTNDGSTTSERSETPNQNNGRRSGMGGGMGGGNTGGSLLYTDDNAESYASIFENAVGNPSNTDKQNMITALKNLSEGNDLEKYFDVDQILRYFAAHNFVVNLDSYNSNMAQNYYLYEKDGYVTVLPWDYNLAFGGFMSNSASSVVNFPIDTPVSGVELSERPLLDKLLENEEYKARYHEYLQLLVDEYYTNNGFNNRIDFLNDKIFKYVKNDATAFVTYEAYQESLPILKQLCELRSESVQNQLNGSTPSTTEGQNLNPSALVDASELQLNSLSSGGMGGGGGMMVGRGDQMQGGLFPETQQSTDGETNNSTAEFAHGDMPMANGPNDNGFEGTENTQVDRTKMREAMQIIQNNGGEINETAIEALKAKGFDETEIEMLSTSRLGERPNNFNPGGEQTTTTAMSTPMVATLSVILIVGLIFVFRFKRVY